MDFNYRAKINEIEELKERNKIIRQLRESKERLLNENPNAIVPFLKEKFNQSLFKPESSRYPPKNYSPIETKNHVNNDYNRDKEYREIASLQRNVLENELQRMKQSEERNNHELKEQLETFIRRQDENSAKGQEEFRNYFKLLNQTQMDILSHGKGQPPIVADLINLKNQYFADGGNDSQILADIDMMIEQASRKQRKKSPIDKDWKEKRKNMALSIIKANELRELERHNAELENQLAINRVRSETSQNKKSLWKNEMERNQMDEIGKLQNQIQNLRQEIDNLRLPNQQSPLKLSEKSAFLQSERINIPEIYPNIAPKNKTSNLFLNFDYISGVGQYVTSAVITVTLFKGKDEIMKPVDFKPVSVRSLKKTDLDSCILLNVNHPIILCPISMDTFVLVQLKVKTSFREQSVLEGWTRIHLFDDTYKLKEGNWKVILFKTPVQMYISEQDLLQLDQYNRAVLHYHVTRSMISENENVIRDETSAVFSKPCLTKEPVQNPFVTDAAMTRLNENSNDEKSDITVDLDEKPEFAIQVIRLKNIGSEDELQFGRVCLTAYHTEGPKKGQILMSGIGPVTCSTNSVRSDFKIAIYQFGRQIGQFSDLDLSVDCVIFARFYLENNDGRGLAVADIDQITKDETLIAWTALPLIKRRRIARNNPSYHTDNLKLLKINKGLHDLPLYEPPVILPTSIFFDKNGFIVGQKLFGRSKLKIRIFHTKRVYDSVTSSDEMSHNSEEENKFKMQKSWIPHIRTNPVLVPYHQDDGFDVYIDSGRMFPDSVTIVKIDGQIVNRNMKIQGPMFSAITSLSSDIFNPEFNERIEIREPQLSPSSTILLKISTFDREEKSSVVLGFAALKIFLETGTDRQPIYDNLGVLVSLNDGGHQIRIYSSGPGDNAFPFNESWFETNRMSYIPGASLLVRLYKSQKNSNGRTINILQVPNSYLEKVGVVIPTPKYEDGYYYSMACKPNVNEDQILSEHFLRPRLVLRDLITSKWGDKLRDSISYGEQLGRDNLLKLFDKFNPIGFNMNRITHYIPMHGFKIAVDGGLNIPWTGYPMAHVSLYPPGALYMPKPLMSFDRPFLVSQLDLESEPSSPIWRDGWKTYRRRKFDKNLMAILHLHELVIKPNRNDFSYSLENEAWVPIQIFDFSYCINDAVQMPLIKGSPKSTHIEDLKNKTVKQFLNDNAASKNIEFLQNASVIIRQCDSRRHLEVSLSAQTQLLTLNQSYIPEASLLAYRSINKPVQTTAFSKSLPVGFNGDSLKQLLKIKFKSLIYKLYYENGLINQ